jgi:chromosome segregation ATPase|eukprot:g8265.t1
MSAVPHAPARAVMDNLISGVPSQHRMRKKRSSRSEYNTYDASPSSSMSGHFAASNSGFRMSLPRVQNNDENEGPMRSSMVGDRSKASSDLKQLRAAYSELQNQFARLQASEASASSHLQQSASQLQELQAQAAKSKKGYEKYKALAKEHEHTIFQNKNDIKTYESQRQAYKKEEKVLQVRIVELEQEVQNAIERAADMQDKLNEKYVEEDERKTLVLQLEQELSNEMEKSSAYNGEKQALLEAKAKLAATVEELENSLKEHTSKNSSSAGEVKRLQDELAGLEGGMKAAKDEVAAARASAENNQKWFEESQVERKRLAEEVDRRSDREKELQKQVINGNKTLQTTAELVEQQKETLLQKERRISTLQNDLAKLSASEFDTKSNTDALNGRIKELEKSLRISTSSVTQLTSELEKLKNQNDRANNAAKNAAETLALQEAAGKRELAAPLALIEELEQELKESRHTNKIIQSQLSQAHLRENKLEKDIKAVHEMKKELIDVRAKQEFAVNEVKLLMAKLASYENASGHGGDVDTKSWDTIDKNIQMLRKGAKGRRKKSRGGNRGF